MKFKAKTLLNAMYLKNKRMMGPFEQEIMAFLYPKLKFISENLAKFAAWQHN